MPFRFKVRLPPLGVQKLMGCSREGCENKVEAKGFCVGHYKTYWRKSRGCDCCDPPQPPFRSIGGKYLCSKGFRSLFPLKWETEKNRKMALNRTSKGRYNTGKSQAKRRGIKYLLSFEEYAKLADLPCHYCDGRFAKTVSGVGLDRLDSSLPYSKDNVVACCGICNKIKSDFLTEEETKAAVLAILRVRNCATS